MFSKRRLKMKNKKIVSYTGKITLTCLDCGSKHEHCGMFYKLYKQIMTLYSVDDLNPQTEHLFDFIYLLNFSIYSFILMKKIILNYTN